MIKKILLISGFFLFVLGIAQTTTHIVSKGDNPYNISKKYGMSLEELLKLNPKVKDGKLNIGDKIIVKGKTVAEKQVPKKTASNEVQLGFIVLKPKQTLYGITKQYHISEADIRKLNPNLEMKIGERVILPQNLISKYADSDAQKEIFTSEIPQTEPTIVKKPVVEPSQTYTSTGVSADDYITYTVQQGDTTFGIVNKLGITLDELIKLNPELASGLKPGMVLKIRKADQAYIKKSGDELNVVLMLPFGYDSGDSKYRNMSLDFLSGAKLAIERNAKMGQKMNVKIVDAGSEETFKNSLTQINKDNTDLIVGPFFKSSVLEVLDYVKDSKIPVVAPFANAQDLYSYSNLIIVETNEQAFAEKIVQEVKNIYSDQKIYIVSDETKTNANYIRSGLENILKNPNIFMVNSATEIQTDTNMMTGQQAPVIAILANDNDDIGNDFAKKMIAMSQEVQGIKAFSMHYSPIFDKKKDELGQANLVYLMDRKINTEGDFEKEILRDFKDKYCKTPSKYAVIGFDVVNDMLTRENNKGEIFKQISKVQTQLATKFEFVRTQKNGAYVNNGFRVIRLTPIQ